jgi:hypothetical protein
MAAMGLRKPYVKMEVGVSCTCMMFNDSRMVMTMLLYGYFTTGSKYLEYISRIRIIKQ